MTHETGVISAGINLRNRNRTNGGPSLNLVISYSYPKIHNWQKTKTKTKTLLLSHLKGIFKFSNTCAVFIVF